MANEYGDLTTLKSMLSITDSQRDTYLILTLAAASRQIDQLCSRRFYLDTVVSDRYFTPERRQAWYVAGGALIVDDIGSLSGLVIGEGYQNSVGNPTGTFTINTGDYIVQPDNALTLGRPITSLRRAIGHIEDPYFLIRVTALWGWPAVPPEIALATMLQAARLYRRKDSPEGVLGSAEWGALRVSRVDPDVEALIAPYRNSGFA